MCSMMLSMEETICFVYMTYLWNSYSRRMHIHMHDTTDDTF